MLKGFKTYLIRICCAIIQIFFEEFAGEKTVRKLRCLQYLKLHLSSPLKEELNNSWRGDNESVFSAFE